MMNEMHRVKIGINDINGIPIREGDYVEFEDDSCTCTENGTEYDTFRNIGYVRYDYDYMKFVIYALDDEEDNCEEVWEYDIKVLGNIDTHKAVKESTDFENFYKIVERVEEYENKRNT